MKKGIVMAGLLGSALDFAFGLNSVALAADENSSPAYYSKIIMPLPKDRQASMQKYNWHPGCPVPLSDLALLYVSYWGFDQKEHRGTLVVNKTVAKEVVEIFKEIYAEKFPIALMIPTDDPLIQGSDDAAMAVNNTSAFNCRPTTGKPGVYSNHSYGLAIDINTMINPYVKGTMVSPPSGYLDRSHPVPGMISHGDPVYNAFVSRGWVWGGDWTTRQDYQHFEKPLTPSPM